MPSNDIRSNEDEREDDFWRIFSCFGRLTGFIVLFLALFAFSIAINCLLLYMALRRRNTKQPQYFILANLAVCDILIAVTPCVHLLPRVLEENTVILSKKCLGFVPIFGNFMIACQMTWTLLAAERYTFICNATHYIRIVRTRYICRTLVVIWTIVVSLNIYHQVLIYYKFDFVDKPLDTLVCDPLTMMKIAELTSADMWLLHGPPGCVLLLSVVGIFVCNVLILQAARNVFDTSLRRSNRRTALKMGCYLGMFLVQMLPLPYSVVMSVVDKVHPELTPQCQILWLFLMMVTPSANAATVIYLNKQFKKELRSLCSHQFRDPEDIMLPERRAQRVRVNPCNSHEE